MVDVFMVLRIAMKKYLAQQHGILVQSLKQSVIMRKPWPCGWLVLW